MACAAAVVGGDKPNRLPDATRRLNQQLTPPSQR
jgi:hypothetical protein